MKSYSVAVFSAMVLLGVAAPGDEVNASEALLAAKCSACHVPDNVGLVRINQQRKTPEGWDMTIARMQVAHGVKVTGDERRTLVKYLADTHGLAPAESAGQRAILERQPAYIESPPDADLAVMCARCHTWGRVALQRRSESEWLKHVHFHVGQYPTLEYQALARDRNWFEDATTKVVPALAKMFPYESTEWTEWLAAPKPAVSGSWVVFGHRVGTGAFGGTLNVTGDNDAYTTELSIDGQAPVKGQAIVYTGYEWRGATGKGDQASRQVMAISEDGQSMSGRWFDEANDSLGASVIGARTDGKPKILGVSPSSVKAGTGVKVDIYGVALSKLDLPGLIVSDITISKDKTHATAMVEAPANTPTAVIEVADGVPFAVYQSIDSVIVEPAEAIARVGGNGGPIASVPAQFDAVAYGNGADGKQGTDDDLRLGIVKASWSVEPFDDIAKHDKDHEMAGTIDKTTGLFAPAGAGPNPDRKFSTNNAGNLNVVASVSDGDTTLTGKGHLIVTVQRFNDPPIR